MIRYYLGFNKHYRLDSTGSTYWANADAFTWNYCSRDEFKDAGLDLERPDMRLAFVMPPRTLWSSYWEHLGRMV